MKPKRKKTWVRWMVFNKRGQVADGYCYIRKHYAERGPFAQAVQEAGFTIRRVRVTIA